MKCKNGIFARYRGICETLGGLLLEEGRRSKMNLMVETSGKDVGSFDYINYFFPDDDYQKLVVYFNINDLTYAEMSVDRRMKEEMKNGREKVEKGKKTTIQEIMEVNCGGPYGGKQLKEVEAASKNTWDLVCSSDDDARWSTWHKAHIEMTGSDDPMGSGWSARAVRVNQGGTVSKSKRYTQFDRVEVENAVVEDDGVGVAGGRSQKRLKK